MPLRLSAFIAQNKELIVQEWENFARTISPAALTMDSKELRDHAEFILETFIVDLETAQTPLEQSEKSRGEAPQSNTPSSSHTHATERLASGYTIHQLISEYRALRASVLRLWAANSPAVMWSDSGDVTRFNEAVDQALAESVTRYSQLVEATIHEQKIAAVGLRQSNQYKDDFLAMLAHELRNPLAPISTAAYILKKSPSNEKMVRQVSEIISRQLSHLTHIVDDLLDVSRLTRGLIELRTESLDVKLIVAIAIEQAQPLIEARHLRLVTSLGSTPAIVDGDKTRLVQVLSNLLNNAAKFTPHGGEIRLALEVHSNYVHLTVSDTGNGIAASLLSHIFELFTQADRTLDRAQGGLGLGLPLVKSIVTLHGGTVEAKSEGVDKGSMFTVKLPLISNYSNTHIANKFGELRLGEAEVRDWKLARFMIVDDNQDAGQLLATLLETRGYVVSVHESAESALTDVALSDIKVFILDIGLPGMNGYELARRLRANHATQQAVLVALTGYGQPHDRVIGKLAGFDYYFVKPILAHQLTELLQNIKA